MRSITAKMLRDAEWLPVYTYVGSGKSASFRVFGCHIPNITIVHDYLTKCNNSRKVKISYRVFGRTTDSPIQAVRLYNEEVRKASLR